MSLEQEVGLLRNISLLSALDDSKLKLLAFTSTWVQYNPGDELCRQGEARGFPAVLQKFPAQRREQRGSGFP